LIIIISYVVAACTGQVRRLLALDDAVDVTGIAAELVEEIRSLGDQAAAWFRHCRDLSDSRCGHLLDSPTRLLRGLRESGQLGGPGLLCSRRDRPAA
jgi:hypothetical protein